MSWKRSSPGFFVRCAELVPCPCCGERLEVIGSRNRKYLNSAGEQVKLRIRRLRCGTCRKIHHELPDFLAPYKRYQATCVENVVSDPPVEPLVAADDSTLYRWRRWCRDQAAYWLGCLTAIALRFRQDPVQVASAPALSAHRSLGRVVESGPGWLLRVVRVVVNSQLWRHTRSAFPSLATA